MIDLNIALDILEDAFSLDGYKEFDDVEKHRLKDALLEVSADLFGKGVEEGWHYESIVYLVREGEEIPQLYSMVKCSGALSENTYEVKIMEILGVRQNKNRELIIEFLGKKTKTK